MIRYTSDIDKSLDDFIASADYDEIFTLCDSHTFALIQDNATHHYLGKNPILIPAGEQHKNLGTAQLVWEALKKGKASRKSLLVNFGGGMVTDLGGFCAATYMRGIDFVNIPTSLLCMVDAAVGAKNGVNFSSIKNMVGTFKEPSAVFINTTFLAKLPKEELHSGWGEVVKHGIIAGGYLWDAARQGIPDADNVDLWKRIVSESISVKEAIVQQDPLEGGLRRILNLGHTFAHALESVFMLHGEYISHGHAVAQGLILEAIMGRLCGKTPAAVSEEIREAVTLVFETPIISPTWLPEIMQAVQSDKKGIAGEMYFALPVAIGEVEPGVKVDLKFMELAFAEYQKYAASV